MPRIHIPARAAALAVLLTAAAAAPAAADSFAYRDGYDVHLVNADGSRSELISHGDENAYPTLPVADDAGNVTVIAKLKDVFAPDLLWIGRDGRTVRNALPEHGPVGLNTGPLSVQMHRDGRLLAYTYLEHTGIYSSPKPHLAIINPQDALAPVPAIDVEGASFAGWHGDRLLASNAESLFSEQGGERFDFALWEPIPGEGGQTVDLARDGRRAVIGLGSRRFVLAELDGQAPPAAKATAWCELPDDGKDLYRGGAASAAISPDGRFVALAGQSGLRIARVDAIGSGPCQLQDVRLVAEKGGLPTSSGYTVGATPPDDGKAPDDGPKPDDGKQPDDGKRPDDGKGAKPAKAVTITRARRRGRTVTVTFRCAKACRYAVRVRRGTRTLKTRKGTAKAKRAKTVTIRGVRVVRGRKLTVRVTVGRTVVSKSV